METTQDRKAWMGVLAKAKADDLEHLWNMQKTVPEFVWLRPPETGSVMVQGRAGATGAPFCLGEITVTRCSVQLSSGEVGHATVQGRDKSKAKTAALADALLQSPGGAALHKALIEPLANIAATAKSKRASKAAATKVDFFTMVRGEDT